MVKILLISPLPREVGGGGIGTWTKHYFESDIATRNVIDIVDTKVIGNRLYNFTKKNLLEEYKRIKKILGQLKSKLKQNRYDIVHINTSCSTGGMFRDYLCIKLIKKTQSKIILHCHCDTKHRVQRGISTMLFKRICRLSDKIFSLNKSSHEHIKRLTGLESSLIPNFIDGEVINETESRPIADNIKNIIFVGHIMKSKGCDDIISVAREMSHINFKMVGFLSEEIRMLKSSENVEFIGEISKQRVFEEMVKADLLLFPTHTEGFPNVVLEAMACGLPIISTPVGAIPDMIEDKGGILVDVGDVDGIVNAINSLQDKTLRKKMSDWNREKVKRAYTIDVVMDEIFQEYRSLMEE